MTRKELIDQIRKKKSFLCVGLDPDLNKLPRHLLNEEDPVFSFNKAIIDATAPFCVAFKPNLAFYESLGSTGLISFEKTVRYLGSCYPDHFVIADAKRGDIGNTAKMYARSFFDFYNVDAVTLSPYMGTDSITPFLEYKGKWGIVLALTSNKGCEDFQLTVDKKGCRLFEDVILKTSKLGSPDNIMYVAGATRGSLLADVRRLIPRNFLLIPGIGSQGGDLEEVAKLTLIEDIGILVNSSRGIIYASQDTDFDTVAAIEAKNLNEQMAELLS